MDKDNKLFLGILLGWSTRGLLHQLVPHTYFNAVSMVVTISLMLYGVLHWNAYRSARRP